MWVGVPWDRAVDKSESYCTAGLPTPTPFPCAVCCVQVEDMNFVKVIPSNLDTLLYISQTCFESASACQVRGRQRQCKLRWE